MTFFNNCKDDLLRLFSEYKKADFKKVGIFNPEAREFFDEILRTESYYDSLGALVSVTCNKDSDESEPVTLTILQSYSLENDSVFIDIFGFYSGDLSIKRTLTFKNLDYHDAEALKAVETLAIFCTEVAQFQVDECARITGGQNRE